MTHKIYCDICPSEMHTEEGAADHHLLLAHRVLLDDKGQIEFRLNIKDYIDVCAKCRERIIDAAKREFDKLKEEFKNGKEN